MKPLEGKIALVTGSSQGIGQGIVERLAGDGARVVVNFVGHADAAQNVVSGITAKGGQAIAIGADISRPAEIETMFEKTLAHYGSLDILVNNAGVATLKPLPEITEEEFDRVFNLNAKGTLFMLRGAALHLKDGGSVVNIASSTVDFPTEGAYIYAGSKAAIKKYTQIAALELGKRGIRVNTVTPGVTETPMSKSLPDSFTRPTIESSPFKRLGKPEDIAAVVAFLVSEEARWVTAQDVLVNGGAKQ